VRQGADRLDRVVGSRVDDVGGAEPKRPLELAGHDVDRDQAFRTGDP
jgi:hypothetical protein